MAIIECVWFCGFNCLSSCRVVVVLAVKVFCSRRRAVACRDPMVIPQYIQPQFCKESGLTRSDHRFLHKPLAAFSRVLSDSPRKVAEIRKRKKDDDFYQEALKEEYMLRVLRQRSKSLRRFFDRQIYKGNPLHPSVSLYVIQQVNSRAQSEHDHDHNTIQFSQRQRLDWSASIYLNDI